MSSAAGWWRVQLQLGRLDRLDRAGALDLDRGQARAQQRLALGDQVDQVAESVPGTATVRI